MSNIDKEWLQQKIAGMEARRDDPWLGLDEDDSNTLAALRIALASLGAEAVAFRSKLKPPYAGSERWDYTDHRQPDAFELENCVIERLFTAPPAPVSVMDEAQSRELFEKNCMANIERNKWHPDLYAHLPAREQWAAWEACRAVMLQGADTELQRKAAIHDALCEKYNVESLADFVEWQRNHIAELEAAPPAPVGQGETAVMPDYPGYVMTQRECFEAGKKAGMAELVTTAYKLPDGYALVPVEPTYQMCEAMGLPWESPRFPDRYKAMIAAAPKPEVK